MREALSRQLWQPVRWMETVKEMEGRGVMRFAECGPGKVLTGLNRRIARGAETAALVGPDTLRKTCEHWS